MGTKLAAGSREKVTLGFLRCTALHARLTPPWEQLTQGLASANCFKEQWKGADQSTGTLSAWALPLVSSCTPSQLEQQDQIRC